MEMEVYMTQKINKVYWTDRFIMVFGENMNTDYHQHHALQLSLCLNGPTTIDCEDHLHIGDLVLIDSNKKHALKQNGLSVLILIDSDLEEAKSLRCHLSFGDCFTLNLLNDNLRRLALKLYNDDLNNTEVDLLFNTFLKCMIGPEHLHTHKIDQRITEAIHIIKRDVSKAYTPDSLSKQVFLSVGRFQHLFKEQTGTSLSKFLLWQRTLRAILLVSKGMSFTDAAMDAGFSDGAHFSRIIKRTFGLTMTEVVNNSKEIEVITY